MLSLILAQLLAVPPVIAEPPANWEPAVVAGAQVDCAALLKGLDIASQPRPAFGSADSCGAAAPVLVTSIAGVQISPAATLTCPMTRALHDWITQVVQPVAVADLQTRVVALRIASSYACRTRNHVAGAKISEHARANAIDISGFSFARTKTGTIPADLKQWLGSDGLPRAGSFAAKLRDGACRSFTTVLGPGSDAAHGDHFHLDMIRRSNGYRICQ